MTIESNDESIHIYNSERIASFNAIDSTPEDDHQRLRFREAMYAFLATVYLQPISEKFLQQVSEKSFLIELSDLFQSEAFDKLKCYLSSLTQESLVEEVKLLKREFMSLFAVPTGRYVAPFEDIYLGKNQNGQIHRGPLLGVRAIAVKRLYREAGAQMDNLRKELPNHVGVELSFMRFLCERQAHTFVVKSEDAYSTMDSNEFSQWEVYRAYQIRFLSEHLNHWFPLLNEEIQEKSNQVFYRTISNLTQEYLAHDLDLLKQQVVASIQSVN